MLVKKGLDGLGSVVDEMQREGLDCRPTGRAAEEEGSVVANRSLLQGEMAVAEVIVMMAIIMMA